MNETTITRSILRELRRRGVYGVKIHGSAWQTAGLPDIWCVVAGRLICLEVKTSRGVVSKVQERQIDLLRRAGATVGVVRSVDEAIETLNGVPAASDHAGNAGERQGRRRRGKAATAPADFLTTELRT